MITRPLDLISHLRPEPRNFGALFYVCVGMIGLQFALFGSRFVLSPGLGIKAGLPTAAAAGAFPTSNRISIGKSGGIVTSDGPMSLGQFADWLRNEQARMNSPGLLIQIDDSVPFEYVSRVIQLARDVGVSAQLATNEPSKNPATQAK